MNQQLLFVTDPVATFLLSQDEAVKLVEQDRELVGFETYIVEQWACSRSDPAISITTFTGHAHHKILATLLELPLKSHQRTPATENYMAFMLRNQARSQEFQHGVIMVANLSTFPSTLTILPISDGSVRNHLARFRLNEALKRMGCTGRTGITLLEPSETILSRFRNSYRVSDRINVSDGVVQMVYMCQIALYLFGALKKDYCDGLLCDMTSSAISLWWREIGFHFYNTEPVDGSLGPSTVSALLGLLLGARSRLHAYGVAVAKEPFDVAIMKRSVGLFQKSQKLQRSRRLDYMTLQRLHKITVKAASQEGWLVQRAVKTTVAELGKGGELMMGMVGAKDRGGITEIETTNLAQFVTKSGGDACQWLWKGKPRKGLANDQEDSGIVLPFIRGRSIIGLEAGNSSSDDEPNRSLPNMGSIYTEIGPTNSLGLDKEQAHRRNVLKSLGGRMTDAKAGLGKIRAVAHSRKEDPFTNRQETMIAMNYSNVSSKGHAESVENSDNSPIPTHDDHALKGMAASASARTPIQSRHHPRFPGSPSSDIHTKKAEAQDATRLTHGQIHFRQDSDSNIGKHISGLSFQPKPRRHSVQLPHNNRATLRISTSLPVMGCHDAQVANTHMESPPNSLSEETLSDKNDESTYAMGKIHILPRKSLRESTKTSQRTSLVTALQNTLIEPLQKTAVVIESIVNVTETNAAQSRNISGSKCSQLNLDREGSEQVLQDAADLLSERHREVEALGSKLDYELGLLHSKIGDVEGAIIDLDQQISALEGRQKFLESSPQDQWVHWLQNLVDKLGFA